MYAEILILGLLRRGPQHGYEIKQAMERALGGAHVTNSRVYPPLKRFEAMGAVTAERIVQAGKPDRHPYRLTALGEELLHDLLVDEAPQLVGQDREFYVCAVYFEILSSDERLTILNARKEALTRRKDRVASWAGEPWVHKVGRLRGDLLASELAIIEQWIREEMS